MEPTSTEQAEQTKPAHHIPNHRITDLNSFKEVTEEPRQIAGLYFYQLLDCLVDLAYDISADFRKRSQLYRDLGQHGQHPLALTLAQLNAKYGTEVDFLSKEQRDAIYVPLFGQWESPKPNTGDSFPQLRDDLLAAAEAFARRQVSDTGVDQLRQSVIDAQVSFKCYLVRLHGDSVRISKEKALFPLTEDICYPILRSPKIAAVFGIANPARSLSDFHTARAFLPGQESLW